MKDIKSLYLTAKSSGKSQDISAYMEAVNELLASNPKDYMLNLEYIISSDIGLQTFDQFIEKYGLSIAAYDDVIACFEKCIGKCERDGKDDSKYQEKKKKLEQFKEQHTMCFSMFESFMSDYETEVIEEKSHGKLKYDFRIVKDVETGHKLKVVYSLDGSKYEDPSKDNEDHESQRQRQGMSSDEILSYNRKYGDTDHLSSGQRVLAIIDTVTKARLKEADVTGIFGMNDSNVFHIKVGGVETRATYKSTFLPRDKNYGSENINIREFLGKGRGTKMNDIDYDNSKDDGIIKYKHGRQRIGFKVEDIDDILEDELGIYMSFEEICNKVPINYSDACNDIYKIKKALSAKTLIRTLFLENIDYEIEKEMEVINGKMDNGEFRYDKGSRDKAQKIIDSYQKLKGEFNSRYNHLMKSGFDKIKNMFANLEVTPAITNKYRTSRRDMKRSTIKRKMRKEREGMNSKNQFMLPGPVQKEYVDVYYSFNDKGVQNNRLLIGMVDSFGECAIPDALITAAKFGDSAINTSLKYLESVEDFQSAVHFQWISECVKEVAPNGYTNPTLTEMESLSLQSIVDDMRSRNNAVFREATLTGNDNAVFEYSEEELTALEKLISFREYQLTCLENTDDIINLQKEIYSLYEEFDGMEDMPIVGRKSELFWSKDPNKKKKKREIDTAISNLGHITDELMSYMNREFSNKIKDYNSGRSLFSTEKISNPRIIGALGDKYGPSYNNERRRIESLITMDEGSTWFNDLRLWILYRVNAYNGVMPSSKINRHKGVYTDITLEVIKPMIDAGKISIDEEHSRVDNEKEDQMASRTYGDADSYQVTVNTYTWLIPFMVNKEIVLNGVNTDLFESVEEFEYLLNESISAMYPIEESPWMVNTMNKKTGDAPSYLANNHDLDYDADSPKSGSRSSDGEDSAEDFRRPSAGGDPDANSDESEYGSSTRSGSSNDQSAVNNYYYYTYNNSLNKNSNSFNKDSSSHDNHSRHDHSVTNDSSVHNSTRRVTDDHSTNKRVHSHDYNTPAPGDDDDDIQEESARPWEVGTFLHNTVYTEGIFDWFKKKKPDASSTTTPAPATSPVSRIRQYVPLTKEEHDSIINKAHGILDQILTECGPMYFKYPIFNIEFNIEIKDLEYFLCIEPGHPSKGYGITIYNGKPDIELELEMHGTDLYEFMKELESNHPEDIERLSRSYNLKERYPWVDIQWGEKVCGYDKSLSDIVSEITKYISSKQFIHDFKSVGDYDSGPLYTGKIDVGFLLEGIDMSNVQSTTMESAYTEDVGDVDDLRPESDHPIKDTLMDVDRKLVRGGQKIKKGFQNAQNAGRAAMKPINRGVGWVGKVIADWKDADETKIKERMADPHARKNLLSAATTCIKTGSLFKAGLLLNPYFLALSITKRMGKNKKEFRLRNEMIGELKMEIDIIEKKIEDARAKGDKNASYKLMRLENELKKKLARVGGGKGAVKSL